MSILVPSYKHYICENNDAMSHYSSTPRGNSQLHFFFTSFSSFQEFFSHVLLLRETETKMNTARNVSN